METKKTNKSGTSTESKRKYNNKAYACVRAELPKQLVEDFKAKCARVGVSIASVLKKAIEEFMNDGTTEK